MCDRFKDGYSRREPKDPRLTFLEKDTFVLIREASCIIIRANLKGHHRGKKEGGREGEREGEKEGGREGGGEKERVS